MSLETVAFVLGVIGSYLAIGLVITCAMIKPGGIKNWSQFFWSWLVWPLWFWAI